jgi:acetoin utilization protein AcuB
MRIKGVLLPMKVKQRMTSSPITATPKTTHQEAVNVMREHHIRRLPVLDNKRQLVGMVSEEDLLSSAPSPATSLSVYEIYALLNKLTLDQIMVRPVYAIDEECSLAAAAQFMIDKEVGCLPVMRSKELIGIITETDMFRAFVEVLGSNEPGLQLDLIVEDRKGLLAAISKAIADADGSVISLTGFRGADALHKEVSIKERGADARRLRAALEEIQGVEILDIRSEGKNELLEFGAK